MLLTDIAVVYLFFLFKMPKCHVIATIKSEIIWIFWFMMISKSFYCEMGLTQQA